jgi:Rrf2 family protein
MNNGRFAISVHILTLLARAGEELLSSEYLAGSININPVLVRKEIAVLRKHGLVKSQEGKNGGSALARDPRKITLADVYNAVRERDLLGRSKNKPNPHCPVGRQINRHLDSLYEEAENALLHSLRKMSLADFSRKFQ